MEVLKPSAVLRRVKAGTIAEPQRGKTLGYAGHDTGCVTDYPTFWENGTYISCGVCGKWVLARPKFADFEIDVSGERKVYPNVMDLQPGS